MSNLGTSRALRGSGVADNMGSGVPALFGPSPVAGKRVSIEARWTGTPTGTFSLECSFDGSLWRSIPGAAPEFTKDGNAQPAGADGVAIWNWTNVPGVMLRVVYTRTSGTGTLTLRAAYGEE